MSCTTGKTSQSTCTVASALITLTLLVLTVGASRPLHAQTESSGRQAPPLTHNSWSSGTPMPTAVFQPAVGVLGSLIYVVGGESGSGPISNTQIYHATTNTWSTGGSLPTSLNGGMGAVVKGTLYVIGGSTNGSATQTNAVWAYSTKTKTWTAKAAMPTARQDAAIVVEKSIIYVIGGYNASIGGYLATVESYNPLTNTWTEEAPLLSAKGEIAAGLLGTTIVVPDGYTGSVFTGDNEGYNAVTNTWKSLKSDPTPRNSPCGASIGALMYSAGGANSLTQPALTVMESFNLSKNSWTTLAPMPTGGIAAGAAVYKQQLYCFGGWTAVGGSVINNVQIYQP
jgi:N-acetylneuraminic acid mutarotase